METKFTPGPWTVGMIGEHRTYNISQVYGPDREAVICHVYGLPLSTQIEDIENDEQRSKAMATARLIAAAPDLYDAILAVKKAIESGIEVRGLGEQILFGEAVEKCRLALQKADGNQQEAKNTNATS